MSLGGTFSRALNNAAAALVEAGVFLAVAAGNEGVDASNSSPASEESVCTVAAINSNDRRPTWSNYGDVVDIFAPGVSILSSSIGSKSATVSDLSPEYREEVQTMNRTTWHDECPLTKVL